MRPVNVSHDCLRSILWLVLVSRGGLFGSSALSALQRGRVQHDRRVGRWGNIGMGMRVRTTTKMQEYAVQWLSGVMTGGRRAGCGDARTHAALYKNKLFVAAICDNPP